MALQVEELQRKLRASEDAAVRAEMVSGCVEQALLAEAHR